MQRTLAALALTTLAITTTQDAQAMNKAELIDAMAKDAGLSKADAKRALDTISEVTAKHLADGAAVFFEGLGVIAPGFNAPWNPGEDSPSSFVYVHAPDAREMSAPGQRVVSIREILKDGTDGKALDSMTFIVADRLDHDEPMEVRGLGTFYVALEVPLGTELRNACCLRKRPGRTSQSSAVDPDSDGDGLLDHHKELRIAAKKVAKFKAGKALADTVK